MATETNEKLDNMIGRTFGTCTIQGKIAVGGFGTVYKAIDTRLEVARAVKIFHPHLSEEKGFKKRFEIEMRLLAQLDHINIVRIINAIDEPDITGFVMEFVEGETLADIIENDGALSIAKTLDVFTQVAQSIAYAHNLKDQIIHRDLSPDNIMIRPDGVVKIMDFGIAKTIGAERVTQTGIVLGKPTYMAPEQFEGTVSTHTDQYALGIILYEMVTGRVPFDAESPISLYKLHLNEAVVPAREINDQVPEFLDKIILKTLAKDEKDRYRNVDGMIDELTNGGSPVDVIENKVAPLMMQANDALRSEDYAEALQLVEEILSYEPSNKEAQAIQAEARKLEKVHKDQEFIEECFYQAQALYDSPMTKEEARSNLLDFLRISRQYPNSRTVQKYKATLQQKMANLYGEAEELLARETEEVDMLTKKGKKLFQKYEYEKAIEYFERAITIDPYSELLGRLKTLCTKKIRMSKVARYYRDGILALKNEDYYNAITHFQQVLELHPSHKDAKKYLELASTELERIKKDRTDADNLYQEGLSLYEKWDFTMAIEKFEQVVKIDGNYEAAHRLIEECQKRLADENKIEEISFFYNQGMTFYKSQQWEKAIKCFRRVLQHMPHHKGALEHLKLAEEKITQQKEMNEAFEEALEHFRNSEYTRSLQCLERILAVDKNHKNARQYLTLCQELKNLNNMGEGTSKEDNSVNVVSTRSDQEGM